MKTNKPITLTRRNFVQRAGLLVTSLGVAGGVQSGLMDGIVRKATNKWGGEALAAAGGPVHFVVEILFRAGFQLNSLFPSRGHMVDPRNNPKLNMYSSPGMISAYRPAGGTKDAYIARFGTGVGGDKLRATLASINAGGERVGLATSESIMLQDSQHTGNPYTRAPNTSAPCPAQLHAMFAEATPVQGIEWRNGQATTNQVGAAATNRLSLVKSRGDFQQLFRDVPMYFTKEELQLVIGEIENGSLTRRGAIDDLDAMFRIREMAGADRAAQVSLSGRGLAQSNLLLPTIESLYAAHQAKFVGIDQGLGGCQLGQALNSAIAAFGAGATTTFTVSLESEDWHRDINALDNPAGKQGLWNTYLGNALSGFLEAAAAVANPFESGKTIADSMLLSMSSEFTRTPNRKGAEADPMNPGNDNGDGGTQAFAYLGSRVKTGSYGNISGGGSVSGFDPQTGATLAASPNVTEAMIWKTTAALMGIPASGTGMVQVPTVPALIKA